MLHPFMNAISLRSRLYSALWITIGVGSVLGADTPMPVTLPSSQTSTEPAAGPAAGPATGPSTGPSSGSSTAPTTTSSTVTLNFKDAPLDTVLNFLSQHLGFIVMKEGPVEGNVTLVSRQPVSSDDAVAMLAAAVRANGSAVVREGRLLRITPKANLKKGNLPVHFGADPNDIADTDEMITQVIPIGTVNAGKLRDDLKTIIGPDADVAANEGSNSLIITDTSRSVKRIVQIIARLDEHEASTAEIHVVRLTHANATATAKLLDTLFKPGGGEGAVDQQAMMMAQQRGQPPPAPTPGKHGDRVVTAADERTNSLIILASTTNFKVVQGIIESIDSDKDNPAPASEIRAFTLRFAQAADTAKMITEVFKAPKQSSPFDFIFFDRSSGDSDKGEPPVNAVADERTNTVIVTAPKGKLEAIDRLIHQLDASPMSGGGGLRVIHLKYADALDVEFLIEDMFKPKDNSSAPQFPFYYYRGDNQDQKTSGVKVTVTSDSRTNSLLVSAPTELLDVIESIVKELDADPTSEDTLFIYHLRNSQSDHLEQVLNVLFGNVKNGQNNPQQNSDQQATAQQQNGSNDSQLFSGRSVSGNNTAQSSKNSVNNRSNRKSNPANLRGVPSSTIEAANDLTGKVLVVADPDTNSLLVTTATKYEQQVRRIIDDLDRAVPQVLIQVLIAEVTHENTEDTGLDFSVLNIRASGEGQSGGVNLGNAAANAANGGLVVSVLESNVSATLHALAVAQRLNVLSRPYILASDNQQATITVGDSVPFVQESRFDQNNNPINTVTYQDIGIVLNVTPHINPDGLVNMDVSPEISSFTNSTIQLSAGVNSPIFSTRSAQSRVGVMDGRTIVIGGLMQDRKTSTVSKVPILGDIPIVGRVFSRVQYDKTKTELLIFLTPHVAARPEQLSPITQDLEKELKLTPHAIGPGVYQSHLRAMRGSGPQTEPTSTPSPVDSIDLSDHTAERPSDNPTFGPAGATTEPANIPAAVPATGPTTLP